MKKRSVFYYFFVSLTLFGFVQCKAQNAENWTKDQLMEPSVLAQKINAKEKLPLIYCIGPGVVIPGSINIGAAQDEKNIEKFKKSIEKLPRSTDMVIYCGCCPFDHCPNVRPAIALLQEMKFTNYHLLDLPQNIRVDWISKGYPQAQQSK